MIDDLTIAEKEFADIKAAEYLGKGYQVLRDAQLDFLPGYLADLLVKKGDETKVIEVKTRPSLAANPALREFKRVINSSRGGRFESLLVGEPERLDAAENAQFLNESGILNRLDRSQKALDAGLLEAGFLLAWTAVEAVVRMLVATEGVSLKRAANPAYTLGMAVFHGAISREDYDHLLGLMQYRNAIAHGFEVSDFSGAMVVELIAAAKSLLGEYREWVETGGALE